MVGIGKTFRLAALGHDVAYIDDLGTGAAYRLADLADQQVGQDAGVQTARSQHHQVGRHDGLHHLRRGRAGRRTIHGGERDARNALALAGDLRLAGGAGAIGKLGMQHQRLGCRRQDLPLHLHPARQQGQRLRDRPPHLLKPGNQQVADGVAGEEVVLGVEAVLEQVQQHGVGTRQRADAVADVAGRHHVDVIADDAAAAAVIGHGHDGRDGHVQPLEAAQDHRQAGPPADHRHPGPVAQRLVGIGGVLCRGCPGFQRDHVPARSRFETISMHHPAGHAGTVAGAGMKPAWNMVTDSFAHDARYATPPAPAGDRPPGRRPRPRGRCGAR